MQKDDEKKGREPYWNYVKNIIRQYPALKRKIETPLDPRYTRGAGTKYINIDKDGKKEECLSFEGGMAGGNSSPVERCVIHDLPPKEQRRFDAVDNAIIKTKEQHPDDWKPRMDIIDLVYFKGTHTIAGAAMKVGCHSNTAGAWQAQFIRLVADELDLP